MQRLICLMCGLVTLELILPMTPLAASEQTAATTAAAPSETPEHRDVRIKWWRDARFGMFIHWSPCAITGKELSWSRGGSKPLDITHNPAGYVEDPVYDNLYKQFNPTKYNAKS